MKNFKKIFALITVICMLASTMTVVFADTKTVSGETYTSETITTTTGNTGTFTISFRVIDGTNDVLITKVNATPDNSSTGMDVEIPPTITYNDTTYDVIGTIDSVFKDDKFSSVIMPDSITDLLGSNLFWKNTKLKSVKLSNNIDSSVSAYTIDTKSVGCLAGVFNNCTNLKEVTLPTGANFKKILSKMFRGCQLDKLVIPDNVINTADDAFTEGGSWNDAWVNNIYGNASSNGIVSKVLALVNGEPGVTQKVYATNFKTYDLGNGECAVTNVADGTNLSGAVYMPDELNGKKVTALMHDMQNGNAGNIFVNQTNLTEFYMADSITKILVREEVKDSDGKGTGEYVIKDNYSHGLNIFYGGSNIVKVHLSDNLTGVVRGFLITEAKITEVDIPAGITQLIASFRLCANLKTVRVADNSQLIYIKDRTFQGCKALEEIVLPTERAITVLDTGNVLGDISDYSKLAIITTEANANPDSVIGKFAASKGIKVYTNLDANIIADAVVAADGKTVTATLRSRGFGYNNMGEGTFRYVCAVYDTDEALAQVKVSDSQTNVDFTSSLIGGSATITLDEAVEAGQTVKVYAWTDLENVVPVAQPAK